MVRGRHYLIDPSAHADREQRLFPRPQKPPGEHDGIDAAYDRALRRWEANVFASATINKWRNHMLVVTLTQLCTAELSYVVTEANRDGLMSAADVWQLLRTTCEPYVRRAHIRQISTMRQGHDETLEEFHTRLRNLDDDLLMFPDAGATLELAWCLPRCLRHEYAATGDACREYLRNNYASETPENLLFGVLRKVCKQVARDRETARNNADIEASLALIMCPVALQQQPQQPRRKRRRRQRGFQGSTNYH